HLIINHGFLYASVNSAGLVQRAPFDQVMKAIEQRQGSSMMVPGGWQVCKVGGGARTIEASPSGRYVFAACNSASALYVVDTREMKVVAQIPVDSYPVGLDISRDGHFVVVTSQARNYKGGNAVNLYRVEYGDEQAERAAMEQKQEPADSVAVDEAAQPGDDSPSHWRDWVAAQWPVLATVAVLLLLVILFLVKMLRRK
ncbi:MAG: hypothetical protein IJ775_02540, partial [Muribaculaceae bacterium]|nr:hypothetical protein [Muribaculaceae bacterium]